MSLPYVIFLYYYIFKHFTLYPQLCNQYLQFSHVATIQRKKSAEQSFNSYKYFSTDWQGTLSS